MGTRGVVRFVRECITNAPRIWVRAQVGGRWQSVALSELPEIERDAHIARWLDEGVMPVPVMVPAETEEAT